MQLATERLVLREWRSQDREPFARMNADPVVMEHFVSTLSRIQSDAMIDSVEAHFREHGFGLWALEVPGQAQLIGFTGLWRPNFEAPFMPAVEVGWRIVPAYWGKGYATEAARAAMADGFERIGLEEIVSFTSPLNTRSVKVMQRLGMTHDPADDFDHPRVPAGHPLRRHVLYRMKRPGR